MADVSWCNQKVARGLTFHQMFLANFHQALKSMPALS